ncbi:hypothetical protein C0Q70_11683 [Pomacea canaliculata]|uniref:MD-2-related lipid-recognition domain-containing protein n=2 Tax=Pomacea canaliculata TaxID=400727 RepID=A0A2T7P6R6_POMCA|nr:hypothetical protein C0Q70_11683 [Pomacea canaliculata]
MVIPYPVQVPGKVTARGRIVLNRPVEGDLTLEVTMKKHVKWNIWTPVPCVGNIGSCSYKNLCTMLPRLPSKVKIQTPDSAGLECPLPAGEYILNPSVFTIPEFTGPLSWLAKGDFRLTAKLIDDRTGEELGCQQVELTIT